MKIAILTLSVSFNYGGILQAYALQTVLQRMGHEVTLLHKIWTNPIPKFIRPYIYSRRLLRKILKDSSTIIFAEKESLRERNIRRTNTDKFLKEYLNLRSIVSLKDVLPNDYEAIVVGSDQVWRAPYFASSWRTSIEDAYLRFTKGWNLKRIAYATSFGKDDLDEYTAKELKNCSYYAQFFDAISVREDTGELLCKDKLQVSAEHVLDPTMLLNKADYEILIEKSGVPTSSGDLFCYILDETPFKREVIKIYSDKYGLSPFEVSEPENATNLTVRPIARAKVESWLRAFKDAKFIITDSFHGTVFSIIFGKPFIVLANSTRGISRIASLLKMFNLESALITNSNDIEPKLYSFDDCQKIMIERRELSLAFLTDALRTNSKNSNSSHN